MFTVLSMPIFWVSPAVYGHVYSLFLSLGLMLLLHLRRVCVHMSGSTCLQVGSLACIIPMFALYISDVNSLSHPGHQFECV